MHSQTPSPHLSWTQPRSPSRLPHYVSHHSPWTPLKLWLPLDVHGTSHLHSMLPSTLPSLSKPHFLTTSSWATEYLLTPTRRINYLNTTLKLNRVPSNHILKTQPVYSPRLMDRVKTNPILPWEVKTRSGGQGAKAGTPEC